MGRRGPTPRRVHHRECSSRAAGSADAFAMSPDCGSGYRGIGLRSAEWGSARQAIPTNHRKMRSHLRLAQNDKGQSEDDGRGDHGSELGKYRPESAGSEWQCLAPCSPTKIFHVGLHGRRRAGLTAQPQPAPAPQGGRSTQGNNSPVNKRTVRYRCKIGTSGMAGRRDGLIGPATWFAVFPPWFSGLRGGERRAVAAS